MSAVTSRSPRAARLRELAARAERYEDVGRFTDDAVLQFLWESSLDLNALVRALKLQRYQSWLPQLLLFEFHRELESAPHVDVTMPEGLDWERTINRPKAAAWRYGRFPF